MASRGLYRDLLSANEAAATKGAEMKGGDERRRGERGEKEEEREKRRERKEERKKSGKIQRGGRRDGGEVLASELTSPV